MGKRRNSAGWKNMERGRPVRVFLRQPLRLADKLSALQSHNEKNPRHYFSGEGFEFFGKAYAFQIMSATVLPAGMNGMTCVL